MFISFEAFDVNSWEKKAFRSYYCSISDQECIDNALLVCIKENVLPLFCPYYDCFGTCNGSAVEDCAGECNGNSKLDCLKIHSKDQTLLETFTNDGYNLTFIGCGGEKRANQDLELLTMGANVFNLKPGIIIGYFQNGTDKTSVLILRLCDGGFS